MNRGNDTTGAPTRTSRYTLRDCQGITREIDVSEDCLPAEIDDFGRLGYDTAELPSTFWNRVYVVDEAGDETTHTIAIDPDEPACAGDRTDGHAWRAPFELVGGLEENPGVWGHGGGVRIHEVCVSCGTKRVTNTWAQDPDTGEQGLRSVAYFEGAYTMGEIKRALGGDE